MKQKLRFCAILTFAFSSVHAQKALQEARTPLEMGIGWATPPLSTTQSQSKITNSALRTQASCNLVRNGNFEQTDYSYSPYGYSGNLKSSCYSTSPYVVTDWENTNAGSCDFFSTLAPTSGSSISYNPSTAFCGSFVPYNNNNTPGATNGCLGMYTYTNDVNNGERQHYQEYAYQKLTSPLSGLRSYYVSMQVYSASIVKYSSPFGIDITPDDVRDCTATTTPTNPNIYNVRLYTATGCGYQSPVISNSQWTHISGTFPGIQDAQYLNMGNFQSDNGVLTRPSNIYNAAYTLVDSLELYEIPWAGLNTSSCSGQSVTIGVGCPIPRATYTWSAPGIPNLPSNSTNISTTVSPAATTTYTLTVNLPNGTSTSSQVTVTVQGAPNAFAYQVYQQEDDCVNEAHFRISDYDPSFNYKLTKVRGNPTFITNFGGGQLFQFIVKVSGYATSAGAAFTVTATNPKCGTSSTSDNIEATYQCVGINIAGTESKTNAYPNPASEAIVIPEGIENATLINDKGKALRQADNSGKLDVQTLPDGLYNLQMMRDGKLINQRIQVKH